MIPLLLASTTEDLGHSHSVADALPHLGGMLMVILTLASLWVLCAVTAKLVKLLEPPARPAPVSTAPAPQPAAPATARPTGTPPELVAAIAAAVATVAGPDRRIVSIRPHSTSWAKAGRQSVLSSHKIR